MAKDSNFTATLVRQAKKARALLVREFDDPKFQALVDLTAAGWSPIEIDRVLTGDRIGPGKIARWVVEARRMLGMTTVVFKNREGSPVKFGHVHANRLELCNPGLTHERSCSE